MKDKVKFLIIAIAVMVVVIMAGTFAWLSYQSNKTAMVLTIGDISTVQVTLSPYQLDASIVPKTTFSDSSNKFINISVDNNSDFSRQVKLFFVINDIDESLISEDFRYTIMRKTTANGTYEPYEDGNFSGVDDAEYEILDETIPANSEYEYKVYVWLYGAENLNEAGVYFNGELRADISNKQYIRGGTFNVDYKAFNSNITRNQVEKIAFQIPKPTDTPFFSIGYCSYFSANASLKDKFKSSSILYESKFSFLSVNFSNIPFFKIAQNSSPPIR